MLLQISLICNRFVDTASELKLYVANMTPGQYKEVVKMLTWDKLPLLTEEIDKIADMLKDENLPYNFEVSILADHVKNSETLLSRTQNIFVQQSPEDIIAQETKGG